MKPHVLRLLVALMLLCAAAPALVVADAPQSGAQDEALPLMQGDGAVLAKIEPLVLKELEEKGATTYLVYLRDKADLTPAQASSTDLSKRRAVISSLQATATRSQASILSYLQAQQAGGSVKDVVSYWVFNGLAVTGDRATVLALAARPDVERIQANHTRRITDSAPASAGGAASAAATTASDSASAPSAVEWNVAKVRAPNVWNDLGITGQGIVVANIDTGAYYPHPALQTKYRGYNNGVADHNYNWFDPTGTYPNAPNDGHGHGTHTMGTMVGADSSGANQIGVAPGAQWIAVKAFDDDGDTTDAILHAAFQWIMAPTDLNGMNADPARAPDIVSNSWGDANSNDQTFWQDVLALRAAGIMPFFAGGNAGPNAGTVDSPGRFPQSFAVGATNSSDLIGSFSGRGPSPWGEIKPDVVAPGVNVRSAVPPVVDSTMYQGGWNGTSMATPHGAAVTALVWQARPDLTITATEYLLTSTAVPLPSEAGSPNNTYGWGRLDAYQAVATIMNGGRFWGRVTDAASGQPVAATSVLVVRQDAAGTVQTTTDVQGYYTVTVGAGVYQATASNFWYITQTVSNIEINAGFTTVLDFALERRAGGVLRGRITAAGAPVTATISLTGVPTVVQAGADGVYSVTLPAGVYDMRVRPATGLRQAEVRGLTVQVGGETVRDVDLAAAPRLLLVDADAWSVGASKSAYWQSDLDALLYTFDLWRVTSTANALPSPATMRTYDIVIWHQPTSSPGYVGAWPLLAGYLDGGGHLLISGQDIGYWDDREPTRSYYRGYLHARYLYDSAETDIVNGVRGDVFTGISVTLNTSDSAANQVDVDAIAALDGSAAAVLSYGPDAASGVTAGLRISTGSYQAIYLAFGLEGTGPAPARRQTLQQALSWLTLPVLQKSADLGAVAPGQTVQFLLRLTNNAATTTHNLAVRDPLPPALSYIDGSASGGLVYDAAQATLSWNGSLAARTTLTMTFAARLESVPGGAAVLNTAYLSGADGSALPTSAVITVVAPDLRQSRKTAQPASVRGGDDITYTITVTNTGVGTAPVSIMDPLPAGTSYVAGSASGGAVYNTASNRIEWTGVVTAVQPAAQPYVVSTSDDSGGPTFSWMDISSLGTPVAMSDDSTHGPFAIGFPFAFFDKTYHEFYLSSNGWLSFVAPASAAYSNVCLPDATAPAAMLAIFWDDLNPTLGDVYYLSGSDTLVVSYVNVPRYSDGGPYTFQVILRADGSILYQYLDMRGSSLNGATIGMQDETRTRGINVACNEYFVHDELVVRAVPSVTGVSPVLGFRVRVAEDLPLFTPLVNTAWLSGGGLTTTLAATVTANTMDLTTSSKTVSSAVLGMGDTVVYSVTVRNTGTAAGTAFVTDTLPAALVYVPGSAGNGAYYHSASHSLLWNGPVAAGASTVITFAAGAAPTVADNTLITNTVTIADPLGHVFQSATATRYRAADLSSSRKDVLPASVHVGEIVTFTITVANGGGGPTTFVVTDTLPAGLSYVTGTAQAGHGAFSFDEMQQRFLWSGELPGEHQTHLRFAARVTAAGTLTNTVHIADIAGRIVERTAAVTAIGPTPTPTPTATATVTPGPVFRLFLPVILTEPDAP